VALEACSAVGTFRLTLGCGKRLAGEPRCRPV